MANARNTDTDTHKREEEEMQAVEIELVLQEDFELGSLGGHLEMLGQAREGRHFGGRTEPPLPAGTWGRRMDGSSSGGWVGQSVL